MRGKLLSILKRPPAGTEVDLPGLMRIEHDSLIHEHKGGFIPLELVTQIEMESFGGPCPKCGKEWAKRYIDNIYVKFEYWQPACRCYPICFNCGNYLLYEIEAGKKFCQNCHIMPSCSQWTSGDTTDKMGQKGSKRKRCEGQYLLGRKGYSCDTCGDETNFAVREGLTVPEIYAGGIKPKPKELPWD